MTGAVPLRSSRRWTSRRGATGSELPPRVRVAIGAKQFSFGVSSGLEDAIVDITCDSSTFYFFEVGADDFPQPALSPGCKQWTKQVVC